MGLSLKSLNRFDPSLYLSLASLLSLLTAIIAFASAELDQKTMITFISFYIFLGIMTLMFKMRKKIINPKTGQLLQFSFFLLGFVLMMTGILGMFAGNVNMAFVFLLMLFLPGLSSIRAGMHFNKTGE